MGIIKKYFYNTDYMTEKEYAYAKFGFVVGDAASASAQNFTAGSYLAGLLAFLGAGEAESNFIISLTIFAGFLQIFLPLLTKNVTHKKPLTMFCVFFDRMPMGLMFLTPFIFGINKAAVVAVGVLLMLSYTLANLRTPLHQEWFIDCVSHGGGIGKFCGIKDSISNATLVLTFFVLARITKHFTGDIEIYGYMWLGIIAIILWAVQFTVMFFIKEPYKQKEKTGKSDGIIKTFKTIFTYKKLRPYVTYGIIYNIGIYLMNSLTSVMYVQRFKMPLELLSYVLMVDLILRTILAPLFGKLADKIGSRVVLAMGLSVLAVSFAFNAFMTASNAVVLRIIIAIVSAFAWAMIGAPSFSFLTESLPEKGRASCIACMNALFLLLGYVSSLITTWFIGAANGFKFNLFGFEFSEMGLVFLVGSLIILVSAITLFYKRKNKLS